MKAEFKLEVESDFPMKKSELYQKLKHWMEHNAHTTSSFGFTFNTVSYLGDKDE